MIAVHIHVYRLFFFFSVPSFSLRCTRRCLLLYLFCFHSFLPSPWVTGGIYYFIFSSPELFHFWATMHIHCLCDCCCVYSMLCYMGCILYMSIHKVLLFIYFLLINAWICYLFFCSSLPSSQQAVLMVTILILFIFILFGFQVTGRTNYNSSLKGFLYCAFSGTTLICCL